MFFGFGAAPKRPTVGYGMPTFGGGGGLPPQPTPSPSPTFGVPPTSQAPAMTPPAPRDAFAAAPSRYHRMAQGIIGQKFNRQVPMADQSGLTALGGVLDNAVDGWASRKGYQV